MSESCINSQPQLTTFHHSSSSTTTTGSERRSSTMSTTIQSTIESHREGAEVFHGAELCTEKMINLLAELNLPRGLIPLPTADEVGYNRSTGFVWLKQPKGCEHYFKGIKKLVCYATEVTAFVEDRKMKKVTGVKSKELVIWVGLGEMFISDPTSGKITFKTPSGLSRTFPVSAFELEETKKEEEEEKEKKKKDDTSEDVITSNHKTEHNFQHTC